MAPMVEAASVHKSFGSTEVLCGVDMVVQAGEVACVIGPSGSGKSTFLRCVNHLERINAGTMRVDGELIGYREANGKLYELRE
ncbi:MAG TPA: ATP-binding cassette domain-containing protein, partial [Pseudonocardia sp.]|nr:ATP-binding cassette domain-containing protein [Pseudonocardia sp.]